MGLAVRLCESLFHFCQYHHCYVILAENVTVINVVPSGTDIKLIVLMLLIMLLTVFVMQFIPAQNSLLFIYPLNLLLTAQKRTSYKCAMKINNSIQLNCLVIILQLFSRLQPFRQVGAEVSHWLHTREVPVIDPHPALINLHFLFCFVCSFFFGMTSVQLLSNSF